MSAVLIVMYVLQSMGSLNLFFLIFFFHLSVFERMV